jgi:hypothetical protein
LERLERRTEQLERGRVWHCPTTVRVTTRAAARRGGPSAERTSSQ